MRRNYLFNDAPISHKNHVETAPDCGVEHKQLLYVTSDFDYTGRLDNCLILEILLQFPSVRLKDLMFECVPDFKGNYPFLHLVALHPDLRVSGLLFHCNRCLSQQFLPTIKQDFKKLFSMPTLKEVSIDCYWDDNPDIMQALILGLPTIKYLNKISLGSYPPSAMRATILRYGTCSLLSHSWTNWNSLSKDTSLLKWKSVLIWSVTAGSNQDNKWNLFSL